MTLVASLVISGVLAAVVLPATTATPDRMPAGLDAALDRLPAGTVVFDEYGLGGYLRYRHPDLVPVIDERTELFTVDYVEAYLSARGAKPGLDRLRRADGSHGGSRACRLRDRRCAATHARLDRPR